MQKYQLLNISKINACSGTISQGCALTKVEATTNEIIWRKSWAAPFYHGESLLF
jgi:hypothetical protein